MADEKATFAIVLEDETSGAADAAAKSLETLRGKIDADTKALSRMSKAMRQMKAAGLKGSDSFKQLADQAKALKSAIGVNTEQFVKLGGTFDKQVTPKVESMSKAFMGANGPLGSLSGGMGKLGALMKSPVGLTVALSVGVVALAVGMAKLTVAALGAVKAMASFAIVSSDARRSEALQIEGLNTLRNAYGRSTASVNEYQAAIDRASDSSNVGRQTLRGYASSLSRAGLRGDALTEAVEAMGIAATVQGERGANRFRALAMNAQLAGGSVSDLAARYRDELGPIARRVMLSLDNQSNKLNDNLERMFGGLNTTPMLEALDSVGSLLSQSTSSGRALKALFEALFQPLIDSVGEASPMIENFFKGMVIGALIAGIGLLRLKNELDSVFPGFIGDAGTAKMAVFAGIAAFAIFVGVLALATVAALALAFAMFLVALPFLIVIGLIGLVIAGIVLLAMGIVSAIESIGEAFEAIGDFISDMFDGIVEAISGETPRVEKAFVDMGDNAASGFADSLGIASPSKVFEGFGRNIVEGAIRGVDSGADSLQATTSNLVEAPVEGVQNDVSNLTDAPIGGAASGPTTISIGDININVDSEDEPRTMAEAFRDELANVLEGVNIELGAAT